MRRVTAGVVVAGVAALVAACGDSNGGQSAASSTTTTKPPVAQAALPNLLLTPAEIDTLFAVTGTTSKEKIDKLQDDLAKQPPGGNFPAECAYTLGPVETAVYSGSGSTAVSGDDDVTALDNDQGVEVGQAVALFGSAKEANDFFNTSAQRWPACENRQFTQPASQDAPETAWKVGPFANTNGVLTISPTVTVSGGPTPVTISLQRALTVRNNVVIDVVVLRKDPADYGVKVVNQIADKVAKQ